MYCPDCGKKASADQKFCKWCGLNLESVSRVLTGRELVADVEDSPAESDERHTAGRDRRRRMLRWGFLLLWIGCMVAALTWVGDAIHNYDPEAGNFLEDFAAGTGGLLIVGGIGLMIYSLFLPRSSMGPRVIESSPLLREKPAQMISSELSGQSSFSVTEPTTNLLERVRSEPSSGPTTRRNG